MLIKIGVGLLCSVHQVTSVVRLITISVSMADCLNIFQYSSQLVNVM